MKQNCIMYSKIILLVTIFQYVRTSPNAFRQGNNNGQNLDTVISSLEDVARNLNIVYSNTYSLPNQNRKLEALETKVTRIETLLTMMMQNVAENLQSKSIKEDLIKDQINMKINHIHDRLSLKFNILEKKIENAMLKLQTNLDATLNRMSTQLEHLEKITTDIENDVLETSSNLEDTKNMIMNFNSSVAISQENKETKANVNIQPCSEKLEKDLMSETESISTKVSSMYNDLNQMSKNNEEMTRKSLHLVNATRRELQDGIKSIKSSIRHLCPCLSTQDENIHYLIEMLRETDTSIRKTETYYQRLDSNIDILTMKQNLFEKSCHRLQEGETQLDKKIGEILEKIMESFVNRTTASDKNYEKFNEMIRNHHSQISKTTSQTTNSVNKLQDQMEQNLKTFFSNSNNSQKIDIVVSTLQELNDKLLDINTTLMNDQQKYEENSLKLKEIINSLNLPDILPSINMVVNNVKNVSTKLDKIIQFNNMDEYNEKTVNSIITELLHEDDEDTELDDDDEDDDDEEEDDMTTSTNSSDITTSKTEGKEKNISNKYSTVVHNVGTVKNKILENKAPSEPSIGDENIIKPETEKNNLAALTLIINKKDPYRNMKAELLNSNEEVIQQLNVNSKEMDSFEKKSDKILQNNDESIENSNQIAAVIQNDETKNKSTVN